MSDDEGIVSFRKLLNDIKTDDARGEVALSRPKYGNRGPISAKLTRKPLSGFREFTFAESGKRGSKAERLT